uniref:Uncharacterized protein n=1 Tax=Tetraselmis sp. GSL018 TaxID=582737 RepID=A0A061QZQ5_9CHLO
MGKKTVFGRPRKRKIEAVSERHEGDDQNRNSSPISTRIPGETYQHVLPLSSSLPEKVVATREKTMHSSYLQSFQPLIPLVMQMPQSSLTWLTFGGGGAFHPPAVPVPVLPWPVALLAPTAPSLGLACPGGSSASLPISALPKQPEHGAQGKASTARGPRAPRPANVCRKCHRPYMNPHHVRDQANKWICVYIKEDRCKQ